MTESMNDTTDPAAIFAPLWKHKWLILIVGVLVAGATYVYYKHQPSVFEASTELNLASGAEEQGLLNGNQSKALDSHVVGDAAALITSTGVAQRVHAKLHSEHIAAHGKVRTSVNSSSDIVTITAEAHSAKAAAFVANAYAQVYIKRQRSAYLRALEVAMANTRRQLQRIEAQSASAPKGAHGKGASKSAGSTSATAVIQAASLSSKLSQLDSELKASGVQQINPAKPGSAALVSPMPKKNAIFGFVLGIALAAIAAFALARLDRRLRTLPGIEAAFQTQILAALPSAKPPIGRPDGRPAPAEALLEPLWRVRAALQHGDVLQNGKVGPPRSILFLSPETGEGKSTLVAGLALVRREAGERVAVIDADLRQPGQARLLEVSGGYGLAEVLAGAITLNDAMRTLAPPPPQAGADRAASAAGLATAVRQRTMGSVSVLASEHPASNPPAVLASRAMPELLRSAAEDYDCVLIDAPSPLEASDVMPLLGAVDGIVLIARAGYTRDVCAERLVQLLARSAGAPVLGTVVNDVSPKEMARHGFSSGSARRRGTRTLTRR
jgi:Mrp family chromosome partitioning ATPase/capsular polysaccharide biosynthesis protein